MLYFRNLVLLPIVAGSNSIWNPENYHNQLQSRQQQTLPPCLALRPTDIWTTCQSFMTRYNVTLPYLVRMNPELQADCYAFKPGTSYCVLRNFPPRITPDGRCSRNLEEFGTCIGSQWGNCCGKTGYCGSTSAFCDIGNCLTGDCPGIGYSTDGSCGEQNGGTICGGSYGKCCSNAGVCGSTTAQCGAGNCQSGECVGSTPEPTTSTPDVPLPSPYSPSPDGTCGFAEKYKCTGTGLYYGNCCSAEGYCGISEYHCSDLLGCQSEFGLCDKTVVQTSVVTAISSRTSSLSTSTRSSSTRSSTPVVSSSVLPTTTTRSITTSSTTTSSGAAISSPGSVCVKGTGVGNLEGLCGYCCGYGYCPPGSCTCLLYAAQAPAPPAATWPVGYPLPGLDSSYTGLCSYACNHGYCPPGACTTTPP